MTKRLKEALEGYRESVAAFKEFGEMSTKLKEEEIFARLSGAGEDAITRAQAAYKAHQDKWYDHYRAPRAEAENIALAIGMDKAEAKQFGEYLR